MQLSPINDDPKLGRLRQADHQSDDFDGRYHTVTSADPTAWSPCSTFSLAMLDVITEGILICRQGGQIDWCNQSATTLLGYDRATIIGQDIGSITPTFTADEQSISDALEVGNPVADQTVEIKLRHQSGAFIPVEFTIRKIADHMHFVAVLQDLRQQKYAQEALRQEHEKLSVTIEHAPMGIVTYRPNQSLLSANRAFSTITGYETNELIKLTIEQIIHPDDKLESANLIEQALSREIPRASHRCRYIHKNGDILYVQIVFGFTHDANGQVDLIIAEVEDLTPKLNAEAQANLHLEQLAHASRLSTLGEMAAGIAHEINQPLTAISLFSQAGKRLFDDDNPEKIAEIFDKLTLHAQRAGNIMQRMQSMARQHQSEKQTICPNHLLTEVAKLAEAEARLRDISIKVDLEPNLPEVTIDTVQIQQVALNLLRNGMEAMHAVNCQHGNIITLSNRLTPEGLIEISVHDTGCGVSTTAAARLFTPFATTKDSGMGLGLSICQPIVNAHGGRIDYCNNPANGATFFFTLKPVNRGKNDH